VTARDELTGQVAESVAHLVARTLGRPDRPAGRARRTPSAERLSTDRIVEVAITQMREHGYDAVTMRSIARALETGPASLYAHVANRAELDQLVVDRVCAQLEVPEPDPARWAQQLRETLVALLELYRAHPGVARCTLGMIPLHPGVLMVTERLLALLKAGGVADQHCAWFVDVASLHVASVAVEEDIWRERSADTPAIDEQAVLGQVRDVFASLPVGHFPWLRSLAGPMTTGSPDDRFAFGLELLVGGLEALSR
jgi:AcrR family transcriptional regulator